MTVLEHEAFQRFSTHEVLNQPPPLVDYNLFSSDRVLCQAVSREGAHWATDRITLFGDLVGSSEVMTLGFQANRQPPILHTHDRFGHRIDQVEFHPSWHELMKISIGHELHSLPWTEKRKGAHVARAALMMLVLQAEPGHGCPISMTYSAVPALRKQPELWSTWEASILSKSYDHRFLPSSQKSGVTIGMAMTEKQGGSDVRANTTFAYPVGESGRDYEIVGHKWFCSAPMSDAFLILAQTAGGLSCFLLPRWRPDGSPNRFFIQRLKDKLGNRSNASSEVELDRAYAHLIGEPGRGASTIIEMVNHTRLDCSIMSAALMRQSVAQATHHTSHRRAFGKRLSEQPLMQNVLADLCLESEAATMLMMRLARSYDNESEAHFRRIATAIAKYWLCKRVTGLAAEAMECHGGNGYVEESIMPRIYREAPLNSIWEGSGNIICLDVVRAMTREPQSLDALSTELAFGKGANRQLDRFIEQLMKELSQPDNLERQSRQLVEAMALALQATLLVRFAPSVVADGFCASRLSPERSLTFGTLPPGIDLSAIIDRARPE